VLFAFLPLRFLCSSTVSSAESNATLDLQAARRGLVVIRSQGACFDTAIDLQAPGCLPGSIGFYRFSICHHVCCGFHIASPSLFRSVSAVVVGSSASRPAMIAAKKHNPRQEQGLERLLRSTLVSLDDRNHRAFAMNRPRLFNS
jgi:hypothetical protein